MTADKPSLEVVESPEEMERTPLRPWCQVCGWRKGGVDSWNGVACKCGHSEPPLVRVDEAQP